MLSKSEIKSLKLAKKLLDSARETETSVEAEIAVIDEKYRKLAEKEKGKLNEKLASAKNIIAFWDQSYSNIYGKSIEEMLAEYEMQSSSTKDESVNDDEDVVVDTTVDDTVEDDETPELDESESKEEAEEEEVEEEVVEETAEVEEDKLEEATEFPDENDTAEEVAEATEVTEDEGWPEFPEEWK